MTFSVTSSNNNIPLKGVLDRIEIINPTDEDMERLEDAFSRKLLKIKNLVFGGTVNLSFRSVVYLTNMALSNKIMDFKLLHFNRELSIPGNVYERGCLIEKGFSPQEGERFDLEYIVAAIKAAKKEGDFSLPTLSIREAKAIVLCSILSDRRESRYSIYLKKTVTGIPLDLDLQRTKEYIMIPKYSIDDKSYSIQVPPNLDRKYFSTILGVEESKLRIEQKADVEYTFYDKNTGLPCSTRTQPGPAFLHIKEADLDVVLGLNLNQQKAPPSRA